MQKKQQKNKNKGFTLIELIIVIVILGILAVVAAPRFINVSSDAKIAALKGMGGAIISASQLVYAKAIVQGVDNLATGFVDLDGDGVTDIETRFGYPSGSRENGVSKVMDSTFITEWTWSTNFARTRFYLTTAAIGGRSNVYINFTHISPTNCYLIYDRAASLGASPSIEYVTSGC